MPRPQLQALDENTHSNHPKLKLNTRYSIQIAVFCGLSFSFLKAYCYYSVVRLMLIFLFLPLMHLSKTFEALYCTLDKKSIGR